MDGDPIRAAREAACEIAKRNRMFLEDVERADDGAIEVRFSYDSTTGVTEVWSRDIAKAVPRDVVRVVVMSIATVHPPPPPTLAELARRWQAGEMPDDGSCRPTAFHDALDMLVSDKLNGPLDEFAKLILRVDEEARR